MAISKTQPMREAEIELVDFANGIGDIITQTANAVEFLSDDLARESLIRQNADSDLRAADSAINAQLGIIETAVQALQDYYEALPVTETGIASAITVEAGASVTGTVYYQNEKEGIPILYACIITNDDEASMSNTVAEFYDVTTTGFKYRLDNPDANVDATVDINWITIGA